LIRIKICCIASITEAKLAIDAGASAIGVVGKMPSGPGPIEDAVAYEICRYAPPGVDTFMLTSKMTAADIVAHYHRVLPTTIQIVDYVGRQVLEEVKQAIPQVKLVQVVHITNGSELAMIEELGDFVSGFLLDSGNTSLAVKELGGTGRTHNWAISKEFVEKSPKPVFLAGGLNPGNARMAIDAVHPYGLDICSGLRTDGALDPVKLRAFMRAVQV
jgi:phosphoribosylanthranilate isomerase